MSAVEKCGRFWAVGPSSAPTLSRDGIECGERVRPGPHSMQGQRSETAQEKSLASGMDTPGAAESRAPAQTPQNFCVDIVNSRMRV